MDKKTGLGNMDQPGWPQGVVEAPPTLGREAVTPVGFSSTRTSLTSSKRSKGIPPCG